MKPLTNTTETGSVTTPPTETGTEPFEDYAQKLNAPFCWECNAPTTVDRHPQYGVRLCSPGCEAVHAKKLEDEAREIAFAETMGF